MYSGTEDLYKHFGKECNAVLNGYFYIAENQVG